MRPSRARRPRLCRTPPAGFDQFLSPSSVTGLAGAAQRGGRTLAMTASRRTSTAESIMDAKGTSGTCGVFAAFVQVFAAFVQVHVRAQ